jgi:hypothetical protein
VSGNRALKITPGEWCHWRGGTGIIEAQLGSSGKQQITVATVNWRDEDAGQTEEERANAALISAAPALYDSLELVLGAIGALTKPDELLKGYGLSAEQVGSIFAALRKARSP